MGLRGTDAKDGSVKTGVGTLCFRERVTGGGDVEGEACAVVFLEAEVVIEPPCDPVSPFRATASPTSNSRRWG